MVERWLDVALQSWRRLAAALVLVPLVLATAGMVADRAPSVQARIWVGQPILRLTTASTGGAAQRPAPAAAQRLREWLDSYTFVDQVMLGVDPRFQEKDPDQQASARQQLRQGVRASNDGDHVLVLGFTGPDAHAGAAILSSLIQTFEATTITALGQSSPDPGAALRTARTDVLKAALAIGAPLTPVAIRDRRTYLEYQSLLALSNAQANASQVESGRPAPDRLTIAQSEVFATLDPPANGPHQPFSGLPATLFIVGLVLAAAAGVAIVTRTVLRDERIRSATEVEHKTGLRYLGSTGPVVVA